MTVQTAVRIVGLLAVVVLAVPRAQAAGEPLDTALVERITGVKGVLHQDEDVYKISVPRTDANVTVAGARMPPFMGLTSWVAFHAGHAGTLLTGEFVLLPDEVPHAIDAALAAGLDVTALHDRDFDPDTRVRVMHVYGHGETEPLSAGVRRVLDKVEAVRKDRPFAVGRAGLPDRSTIDAAALAEVIGVKPASVQDGMARFTIGRKVVMPCHCQAGKEMGAATSAAFYGSAASAFVDGEFITFAGELQPVLKTLRARGMNVLAIHSHMEGEDPKAVFVRFRGFGTATELAAGVKTVLDAQRKAAKPEHPIGDGVGGKATLGEAHKH